MTTIRALASRLLAWLRSLPTDRDGLTDQEKADARKLFEQKQACVQCGGIHARACPRVRRLEFGPSGAVTGVEFWPDGQWPTRNVIWPEDVQDDE